jgi:hypothetical protein
VGVGGACAAGYVCLCRPASCALPVETQLVTAPGLHSGIRSISPLGLDLPLFAFVLRRAQLVQQSEAVGSASAAEASVQDLSAKVEEQARELARLQSELGVTHSSSLGRSPVRGVHVCLECLAPIESCAASSWQTKQNQPCY